MHKLAALLFIVFVVGGAGRLQAQSLKGTAWKFYVEALHDDMFDHACWGRIPESYTTSSSGELIVRSVSSLRNDTLRLRDVTGEYYCPDGEGVYRIKVDGDFLNFFLVTDPCQGRSEALNGNKFRKSN